MGALLTAEVVGMTTSGMARRRGQIKALGSKVGTMPLQQTCSEGGAGCRPKPLEASPDSLVLEKYKACYHL